MTVVTRTPTAHPSASVWQGGADCGPRALAWVCGRYGVPVTVKQLCILAGTTSRGTSMAGLAQAAEALGLQATGLQVHREGLTQIQGPAIAWMRPDHFLIFLAAQEAGGSQRVTIHDPNFRADATLSGEQFLQWSGGLLLLIRR